MLGTQLVRRHDEKIFFQIQNLHKFKVHIQKQITRSKKICQCTSAEILPTIEIVSTGYNPRRVSAPSRIASLPILIRKQFRQESSFYMTLEECQTETIY